MKNADEILREAGVSVDQTIGLVWIRLREAIAEELQERQEAYAALTAQRDRQATTITELQEENTDLRLQIERLNPQPKFKVGQVVVDTDTIAKITKRTLEQITGGNMAWMYTLEGSPNMRIYEKYLRPLTPEEIG